MLLTGTTAAIADISLYAYTHVANEGAFELSRYPAITEWLYRIESLSNYISMKSENV